MAPSILYAFSLLLLVCAVLSKPVAYSEFVASDSTEKWTLDVESVPSSESVFVSEAVLSASSDVPLRRFRRETIVSKGCPGDMIWFMKRCMTFERYERLVKEEEEE